MIRHEVSRNEISQKVEIFSDIILFKTEGWIGGMRQTKREI